MTRIETLLSAIIVRLYPRVFRDRYGESIAQFHRDRARETAARHQSSLAAWLRIIIDGMLSAGRERMRPAPPNITPPHTRDPMQYLAQDFRYALRTLARRPAFAIVVIGTIALGVGANAAIFSVVNGILLRPLPYPDPDRVVSFNHEPPQWLTSDPDFLDYQRGISSLQSLAAYTQTLVTLASDGEPERLRAVRVSTDFFRTLGVVPAIGRAFGDDEFQGNPPTAVILSDNLWKRRFGGEPSILNKTILINGVQRTVVGVMPAHFNYPEARTDVWVPMPAFTAANLGHRANNYLFMVGRVKPSSSVDVLRTEAAAVAKRIMQENASFFDPNAPLRPHIEQVGNQLVKNARPYLYALLGTVGFVLLIACANVANLLLARAEGRRREMAVRAALGASGTRLVSQLFTESAVVACAGGIVGLTAAWSALRVLKTVAPGAIPRIDEVGIDVRVLMFTLAASILTGVMISLVPALRTVTDRSFDAMRSGGRTPASGAARGARRALVVAEVALAVVALTGAGMLLRSLWNLQSADIGFDARNVLTARVSISQREYNNDRTAQFYQQVLERLRATPGVTAAAAAGWLPVVDAGGLWGIIPEGRVYGAGSGNPANQPLAVPQQVTPGYFAASGTPLVAGRDFIDADREGAPEVAVISEAMAKQLWPGEDALGKRFRVGGNDELPLMTVVGVVRDIRARGFADTPEPTMYFPLAQTGRTTFFMPRAMALVVRTTGDPFSVSVALKNAVHALDAAAPVSEIRSLEQVVGTSVATRKFSTSLLTVFSLLALMLAGIGTYGVIAYGVAQRTYEIGVRMALGAERGTVVRLVMGEGLRMCAVGIGVGVLSAVVLARSIRTMLVDVPSVDVVSLVGTSAALLLVAIIATFIPARRALGVNPTEALRGG